ncbi:MAG: response regulator transcription factor [Betaproteobacteria bacterium]|nr:response regulator transcription factor [Betaproteobacteria bacterium]MDE2046864.1 response regulator transcription factor [Betaproteobacteria bacterium]
MTRVLIADDHAIVRDGLKRLIESSPGLHVAGEAVDGDDTVHKVRSVVCDVLLLDMSMPGRSGLDLIKYVKTLQPRLAVLVLSMHAEDQYAVRAIRAGASGYLTKDTGIGMLVEAIRKVAAGGMYITAAVAEQLAMSLTHTPRAELPHQALSDRELEVFHALVRGDTIGAIAQRMHLSAKTVSTHKARILEKMQMDSVADLVRYALAHQLSADASAA